MKAIEEYKVKGKFNEDTITGKVTLYPNNFSKIPLASLVFGLENSYKKSIEYLKNNGKTKVAAATLAGVVGISALTGCSPKQVEKEPSLPNETIEETYAEPTQRISYKIKFGDTLTGVASKYCSNYDAILKEVDNICRINNIADAGLITADEEILLDVPYSKLSEFGEENITIETKEPTIEDEWLKKEYYISNAWTNATHSEDNLMFERDRSYVFEGLNDEPGDLIQIASLKFDLELLKNEGASEESIEKKIRQINSLYDDAIELTERNTGTTFGTDYIYGEHANITK